MPPEFFENLPPVPEVEKAPEIMTRTENPLLKAKEKVANVVVKKEG
jgi:hypothetical protein